MKKALLITAVLVAVFLMANCSQLAKALQPPAEQPTQDRMMGLWKVVEAYDENDTNILSKVSVPVCAIDFQSLNAFISTAGPMGMYIVYGGSGYVQYASALDQVFDYLKLYNGQLQFNIGDWYIDPGVVSRFTMKFRLSGLPGQSSLSTLLSAMGMNSQFFNSTIYHLFDGVKISFNDGTVDTMKLALDDSTTAQYYTLDSHENKTMWLGASAVSFHKCKFVLVKQTMGLDSLVRMVGTPHS
jgi:hypothetical protein